MSAATLDSRRWISLEDGRRLSYTVTGPLSGRPVLYCHGAIGTPVNATVDLEAITRRLGVRWIAPSRPGIGGSDPAPGRSIAGFAADAAALAAALELESFHVIGVSAGGPYALAIAHALPDRVRGAAVVSALSPLCAPHATPGLRRRIRWALGLLEHHPQAVRRLGNALLPLVVAHPALLSRGIAAHAAPGERARLASSAERLATTASFVDSCASGVAGLVDDYGVYSGPWGFDLGEIPGPVDLWHGAADPLVPVEHALQLAAALPRCRSFLDPEEGHHFFRARLELILETLLQDGSGAERCAEGGELIRIAPGRPVAHAGERRFQRDQAA